MRKIMCKEIHALLIFVELLAPVMGWAQHAPARNLVHPSSSPQIERKSEPSVNLTFGTIDFPGAPDSDAQGINDKNEIVGAYGGDLPDFRQGLPAYGFIQKGSSFKKLAYPGAPITLAFGVNNPGEVVGAYSLDPLDYSSHGFTLIGKVFTSFDYPGGAQYTVATAINKSGQIVGLYNFTNDPDNHGFLLNQGVFSQITFPAALGTSPYGINDAGEIVGQYTLDNVVTYGFSLVNGVFTTISYPSATDTYVFGINNNGQIVGAYDFTPGSAVHGFVLDSGNFTTFDVPYAGAVWTYPYAINNRGRIVGQYWDSNNFTFGFSAQIGK